VPYFQNTPFWLVGELLRNLLAGLDNNRNHGYALNVRPCSLDHETPKVHLAHMDGAF
jgi:hypothetical protein